MNAADILATAGAHYLGRLRMIAADVAADEYGILAYHSHVDAALVGLLDDHERLQCNLTCHGCTHVVIADVVTDHAHDIVWIGASTGGAAWLDRFPRGREVQNVVCDGCVTVFLADTDVGDLTHVYGRSVCRAYLARNAS